MEIEMAFKPKTPMGWVCRDCGKVNGSPVVSDVLPLKPPLCGKCGGRHLELKPLEAKGIFKFFNIRL
jgi:hypothetical protein